MSEPKTYYAYIMTNKSKTLYTGVTNDLERRVFEHKQKLVPGFTKKYNITRLAYFETFDSINQAIEGEKALKGLMRWKKIALIENANPEWQDLSEGWFEEQAGPDSPGKQQASKPEEAPIRDSSLRSE